MNPMMQVWRQMLVQARSNGQGRLLVGLVWLLTLLGLAGVAFGLWLKEDSVRKACAFGGFCLMMLALMHWTAFMGALSAQNTPANAKLVPGLNRNVRKIAALVWLLTALAVLPYSYGFGHAPIQVLGLVVGITGLGVMLTGREEGAPGVLVASAIYLLREQFPSVREGTDGMPALIVACLVAAAYVIHCLRSAFPVAGEAHYKQLTMLATFFGLQSAPGEDKLFKAKSGNRIYQWQLLRACARRDAGKLLLLGLGPYNTSLVVALPALGLMLAGVLLALMLKQMSFGEPVLPGPVLLKIGFILAVILVPFISAIVADRFSRSFKTTVGEQAVLRLTPAMPPSHQLTRELCRRVSASCAREWLVTSVALCVMLFVWTGNADALKVGAMISAGLLTMIGLPLTDYARKAEVLGDPVFLLLTVWIAGLIVASLFQDEAPLIWAYLFFLVIISALAFVLTRWKKMMQSPVAFPVGRLA